MRKTSDTANGGVFKVGDRCRFIAEGRPGTGRVGTITGLLADEAYYFEPDAGEGGVSFYIEEAQLEATGEPRRCQKPQCKNDAINGYCRSCQATMDEKAQAQRTEVGRRIRLDTESRSNAAQKAWATRRAANAEGS